MNICCFLSGGGAERGGCMNPRGGDGGFVAQPAITVKTENFFRAYYKKRVNTSPFCRPKATGGRTGLQHTERRKNFSRAALRGTAGLDGAIWMRCLKSTKLASELCSHHYLS